MNKRRFLGTRRCGGFYIPFAPPAMQHSFGQRPALCCIAYTRRTNIRKPPVLANIRPSAATGNGLSGTVTAPFQRQRSQKV